MKRSSIFLGGAVVLLVAVVIGGVWALAGDAPASPTMGPGSSLAQEVAERAQPSADVANDIARQPIPLDQSDPIPMTVYLSPTCGCCSNWIAHIEEHGFEVELEYRADMNAVKEGFAVAPELSSCHTAVVNGYLVEGHVPGEVVRRFLAEAPAVRGLAVPGMPLGSPGMEVEGGRVDPYDVLIFTSAGEVEVYSEEGRG